MQQNGAVSDRITEIQIQGLRTVINVRLKLSPLTVLIGENGSGKSTIIEACELLRRASQPNFLEQFVRVHDGLSALRSAGTRTVHLGVRVEGVGLPLSYEFQIEDIAGLSITRERLWICPDDGDSIDVVIRDGRAGRALDHSSGEHLSLRVPGSQLLLTSFGLRIPHPAIQRMIAALEQIDVRLPFPTLPTWILRSTESNLPSLRQSSLNQPTDFLTRLGANLANVFQRLKDDPGWFTTMDYIQLGLGEDIEDVLVRKGDLGDRLEIWFKYKGFESLVPARSLSDGTLDYLAFVALFRLAKRRSLMAFDEPEVQLHSQMARRVAQFLESLSQETPILVATHSDRFLDALTDPAASVVLCRLGFHRETELIRPDRETLSAWLQNYSGLGELLSAGHGGSIMTLREKTGK